MVFDWHNIESELLRRYSSSAPFPKSQYATLTAAKLARLEDRVLRDVRGHLVCSEHERQLLLRRVPTANIAVIENGVDIKALAPLSSRLQPRDKLVFVGSFDYHANIEGAVRFVRECWPGIRRTFPGLRLSLVGSNPTAAVRKLAHVGGVDVVGTVPSVASFYEQAVAAIVPLFTGGGTRLKILEAMAARVPVISTPVGHEGLAVTPGSDILTAETPDQWIQALEDLLFAGELREKLIAAAFRLISTRYDWDLIGEKLWQTYSDLGGSR